ncbi:hypothetical protein ACOCEA_13010 [Maribacter sp. CXY002]|uniref:hypothetical protein n=1 Tax=Maribacter luteocoastalis TaxID=3407671 RepID=UPI003B684305
MIDSKTKATFGFRNKANELITMELEAVSLEMWEHSEVSKLKLTVPGIKNPKTVDVGFWFAPVSGIKALYIQFTDYPSFEEMQVFGEHLAALFKKTN